MLDRPAQGGGKPRGARGSGGKPPGGGPEQQKGEAARLLSALTFVWIYAHRNAEFRYNRLRELLDRQAKASL
jgi:hypothetical protein